MTLRSIGFCANRLEWTGKGRAAEHLKQHRHDPYKNCCEKRTRIKGEEGKPKGRRAEQISFLAFHRSEENKRDLTKNKKYT